MTPVRPVPALTIQVWQGSHCCGSVEVTGMTQSGQRPTAKAGFEPKSAAVQADAFPTGPRLLVVCLTSHQHASVSQGRICSDNFTCCHTEIEVAYPTFHLTQSQYTDTGPTSPSVDPITPGAWQGSHWSANFCHRYDWTPKKSRRKRDSNPGSSALEADALTTRPTRRSGPRRREQEGPPVSQLAVHHCGCTSGRHSLHPSHGRTGLWGRGGGGEWKVGR